MWVVNGEHVIHPAIAAEFHYSTKDLLESFDEVGAFAFENDKRL